MKYVDLPIEGSDFPVRYVKFTRRQLLSGGSLVPSQEVVTARLAQ
jgi:hypothetical protein